MQTEDVQTVEEYDAGAASESGRSAEGDNHAAGKGAV